MTVEYKRRRGQSIIETVVGIIFLIPIVLFLFDVAVLVLASSACDNLAKSAARAASSATNAAGTGTRAAARDAAVRICTNFAPSTIITPFPGNIGGNFLTGFNWNNQTPEGPDRPAVDPVQQGQVAVVTTFRVQLPVPFPLILERADLRARAVEPIVSIPP